MSDVQFIACEPNSEEWFQLRAGVITASTFADAISITGGLTEQQQKYYDVIMAGGSAEAALAAGGYKSAPTSETLKKALAGLPIGEPSEASNKLAIKLAMERISGKPYGPTTGSFFATERGHENEFFAREKYSERYKTFVDEPGFARTHDKLFGYSTDGFVMADGLIEVKCPLDTLKVVRIIQTGDLSEYMHQMQGGMWLTGRKWCDFLMAIPDLAVLNNGNDLYVKRVYRDDNFIDDMVTKLWAFAGRVKSYESLLRKPFTTAANDAVAPEEKAAA